MAAIYSNGGNRWNILGFNFTKRDALSSVYKISMKLTLDVCNLQSSQHLVKPTYIFPFSFQSLVFLQSTSDSMTSRPTISLVIPTPHLQS